MVSLTFRHIIDDVIANVRQDFEDMGIEKEVLEELQRSWEAKLVATQVTEFDGAGAAGRASQLYTVTPTAPLLRPLTAVRDGKIEAAMPTAAAAAAAATGEASAGASGSAHSAPIKSEPEDALGQKRKRELDDEGQRADDAEKGTTTETAEKDKDEIGSDLDDSDDDDAEGTEDMILCLYDKVQRVKNKWKCVLRDGVASIGGRDYLFSKCNGYVRPTLMAGNLSGSRTARDSITCMHRYVASPYDEGARNEPSGPHAGLFAPCGYVGSWCAYSTYRSTYAGASRRVGSLRGPMDPSRACRGPGTGAAPPAPGDSSRRYF